MRVTHRRCGIEPYVTNGAGLKRNARVSEGGPPASRLDCLPTSTTNRSVVRAQVGDLVVLYTDGVSEATNPAGEELGRDGLMNIGRKLDPSSAEAFGTQLTSALRGLRGGVEPTDDETIIVLEAVAIDPTPR
ncbi:MAG TPA: SpoIIE family protein phosphatase [Gemmatimonadales bacterium]|nr:SpoIIE family protein phosphatase [Gemmatimonadales bacterium]